MRRSTRAVRIANFFFLSIVCLWFIFPGINLCPDPQERVPGGGAEGASIARNTQARDSFVAPRQIRFAFGLQSVPNQNRVVGIGGVEEATGGGEGERGWCRRCLRIFGFDVIAIDLSEASKIEKSARSIVGTRSKGCLIGEELNNVYIGFMLGEDVSRFGRSKIPTDDCRIARARDKHFLFVAQRNEHNVASVLSEDVGLLGSFNVPQDTRMVTRRGKKLTIVQESTARQKSVVTGQFTRNFVGSLSSNPPDGTIVV